ncbi:septum formation initiator family protein [Pseudodesulfovibrio senegalensis]|jgi:cell division protein FtsB|uniref:Septum formation initiator family protein n=1 Tax=Pseudodesulfovibrio senegalensis TaxID=1721087 RepID=A0A6N6N030_9BACT|nr:septum formation initiator family protein [Pseudodesulfovibrio senegalensis]KAB1441251.1 septum formation initiator family protein [Pseudodesulfovibrio senegalensis]
MIGKRVLLALLILINLFLFCRLIWSGQGLFAYLELKDRHEVLQRQIEDLDARSLDLSKEIIRLKSDRAYQEKIIRDRMNFVKKDEILYLFPENGDASIGDEVDGQEN